MEEQSSTVDKIRKVYKMLDDETSRDIYLKRLNFLFSYDFKFLDEIVTHHVPKIWPEVDSCYRAGYEPLLNMLPEDRNFVLYGAGYNGARWLTFAKKDKRFIGFCSRTKQKQENGYYGYPVMSPEELLARKDLSVIISTVDTVSEILEVLESGGYPRELIFDGTMFGEGLECDPNQYFDPEFMTFENEEVFVDAGCYDLSTSLNLRKRCQHLKSIAFEPDPYSYECCLKRKEEENFADATIFPFGTWSKRSLLNFSVAPDGSSHVGGGDK